MFERTLDEVDPGHRDDSSHRSSIGIHIGDSSGGRSNGSGGGRNNGSGGGRSDGSGGGRDDGSGRGRDVGSGGGSRMVVVVDHLK